MSFFTAFLENTSHFGKAIEQAEQQLKTTKANSDVDRLQLLVRLAYCYAQLQKGIVASAEQERRSECLQLSGGIL